jgi:hypothetical protein
VAAADSTKQRKEARAEKKSAAADELQRRRAEYEACRAQCVCAASPCKFAGLVFCTVCGDVKKKECRKRACVAAKSVTTRVVAGPSTAHASSSSESDSESSSDSGSD